MKNLALGVIFSFALVFSTTASVYSGINFPGDKKKKSCESKSEGCKSEKKSCCGSKSESKDCHKKDKKAEEAK